MGYLHCRICSCAGYSPGAHNVCAECGHSYFDHCRAAGLLSSNSHATSVSPFGRTITLIFLSLFSLCVNAQFIGGFGCGDPDAWFDKEIYFYCQNQARNYYGYGVNLQNVSFVIDGETQIDVYGIWEYGDIIIIDKDNEVSFDKGSVVGVYVNGQYYGSWTCYQSDPTAIEIAKRTFKKKPKGRLNLNTKGVLKILRKFKK